MNIKNFLVSAFSFAALFIGCKKDDDNGSTTPAEPQLIFKYKFDSTQIRLNSLGGVSVVPSNHGAQSPVFNGMSSHYIELTPTATTALGTGAVLYHAAETSAGSSTAIDFSKATIEAKMKFLENYVDISSNRSKGYNYLKSFIDNENTSVLKKKVSLMFNIQEYGTKRLGNNSLDTSTKTNQSKYKIGNASSFTFCSNQENVIAEALAYGTSRLHYDIQLIEKERYEIYFVHPINKEKYAIYQGKSLLECEESLKKLLQNKILN